MSTIPLEFLSVVALSTSAVCAGYSVLLGFFRHANFEGRGVVDTLVELFLNTSPLLVASFTESKILPISILVIGSSAILILRSYNKYVVGVKFRGRDLSGKVYIVTGSNTGIGLETAAELANLGATVVLGCRSLSKANEAKKYIIQKSECSTKNVIVIELDLCSFASIRAFVKRFKDQRLPLHCLINNAGVMIDQRTTTQEGLETVFTANHLGPFLLTQLLLPILEENNGRIVMVSSSLHFSCQRINFEDVMLEKQGAYSLFGSYAQSKLANLLYSFELQRRLWAKGSKVTVNAVHPGLVRTDIPRNMSPAMRTANVAIAPILMALQKTPRQGAFCTLHAAIHPEWEAIGAKYISNCRVTDSSVATRDLEAAKKIWELSEKLTGLNTEGVLSK